MYGCDFKKRCFSDTFRWNIQPGTGDNGQHTRIPKHLYAETLLSWVCSSQTQSQPQTTEPLRAMPNRTDQFMSLHLRIAI